MRTIQPPVEEKVKTQQHFAEQTDIRHVMRRYRETGVLSTGKATERQPMYFDTTELPEDYAAAVAMVNSAKTRFDALPAAVRQKFNYDPQNLLKFIQTGSKDEAIELGLIEKPGKKPEEGDQGEPDRTRNPLDVRVRTDTNEKGVRKKRTTTVVEEEVPDGSP